MSRNDSDGGQRQGSNDERDGHRDGRADGESDPPRGDGMVQTINACSGDLLAAMREYGKTYGIGRGELIAAASLALAGLVAAEDGRIQREVAIETISESFAETVNLLREATNV